MTSKISAGVASTSTSPLTATMTSSSVAAAGGDRASGPFGGGPGAARGGLEAADLGARGDRAQFLLHRRRGVAQGALELAGGATLGELAHQRGRAGHRGLTFREL